MNIMAGLYPERVNRRAQQFMTETRELAVMVHLSNLGPDAHVIAPEPILERLRSLNPKIEASLSSCYDSPPPFSPEIYIYDLTPGSPSRAMSTIRPFSKVRVINLDVVAELTANAAARQRRRAATQLLVPRDGKERTYCILHTPRAGGTVLTHLLAGAGIGRPSAHLRAPLSACLREGFTLDDVMLAVREQIPGPAFGTQINVQFLDWSMRGRLLDFADWVRKRNVMCVAVRRDVIDQAVSLHFAASTGLWETWNPAPEDYGAGVSWDRQKILERIEQIQKLEALLDNLLSFCPPENVLILDHKNLRQPGAAVRKTADFLGFHVPGDVTRAVRLPVPIGRDNQFMRRAVADVLELAPGL